MWEPQPGWLEVPGGTGPATVGVWRTEQGGRPLAVKRLARPGPHDAAEVSDPAHFAYWRREADVVESGLTPAHARAARAGRGPRRGRRRHHDHLRLGRGRRQQRPVPRPRPRPVRRRRPRSARAGCAATCSGCGWLASSAAAAGQPCSAPAPPTSPTACGPVASTSSLQYDALPQVPHHGDVAPANLRGREGDDVLAIDWSSLGVGPIGTDLGLHVGQRARGPRAAPGRLPARSARRDRDGRRGAARDPGGGRLHGLQPGRVGVVPGRGR